MFELHILYVQFLKKYWSKRSNLSRFSGGVVIGKSKIGRLKNYFMVIFECFQNENIYLFLRLLWLHWIWQWLSTSDIHLMFKNSPRSVVSYLYNDISNHNDRQLKYAWLISLYVICGVMNSIMFETQSFVCRSPKRQKKIPKWKLLVYQLLWYVKIYAIQYQIQWSLFSEKRK